MFPETVVGGWVERENVFCARLINTHGRPKMGDSDLDNKEKQTYLHISREQQTAVND